MSNQSAPPYAPHPGKVAPDGCITFIGMAASGKSSHGRELAKLLDWAHVDTDHLIEAMYGARLQNVADALSKEEFLDMESSVIRHINLKRCVLSTGGSVVYRHEAMLFLAALGPIIHLAVPLPIILERIARKPDRGLAIAPGQTIEDLYNERRLLYEKYATHTIRAGESPVAEYVRPLAKWLAEEP